MNHEYLSVREAAELLHVAPKTIRRWIDKGELPYIRIGRTVRIPTIPLRERTLTNVEGNAKTISIPNEAAIRWAKMTEDERDAYAKELLSTADAVRAQIRAKYGVIEDSVSVLTKVRVRDGEDE